MPAPAGYGVLGVVGAGAQAEPTPRGLAGGRRFRDLVVHATDPGRAAAFAARHGGRVLGPARAVAGAADVALPATRPRTPLPALADTGAGQHLTSLGADEPGTRELAADLPDAALLVVDDRERAATAGASAAPGPAGRRRPPHRRPARPAPRPDLGPAARRVRPRRTAPAGVLEGGAPGSRDEGRPAGLGGSVPVATGTGRVGGSAAILIATRRGGVPK
ncbi:hypothetical protein ABZ923_36730 [Streptomyces sp. NPDC046881]|uniref:hypothetical protein n=1 Tax=Streptomyces sp. NPDC046881 TaxID=3155374 RepID=UPI0033E4A626